MKETIEPINAATVAKYAAVAAGILIVLWILPMSCSDPAAAIDAAEDAGFAKVTPGGYRHFGCGWSHSFLKGYGYQTAFEAVDASSQPVVGVVCAGYGKAPYVRTYTPGTFAWRLRNW